MAYRSPQRQTDSTSMMTHIVSAALILAIIAICGPLAAKMRLAIEPRVDSRLVIIDRSK